jgi:predicted component of type VI protein secretion system
MSSRAFLLAAALLVAGCQAPDPGTPGTVLSVQEQKPALTEDLLRFDDDNLRVPEVAWKIEVELDDGSQVIAIRTGARRYMPGERVRVVIDADGALLL